MWYRKVNIFRVSVTVISWINRQEEHRLSSAQILTSRYQSIIDNRVKIECAPNMMNVREYSSSNQLSCIVGSMRLLQNVLEELGGKQLFPNDQSNTDIFVWILRLQTNKLSIDHQTNSVLVNDDLRDGILSCRIELLHLLLNVTSDCCFDGLMSIHLLWCIGFAFAFDLAATTLVLVGGVCSSCGSAGISEFSSSIESITYLTVPWEILIQE